MPVCCIVKCGARKNENQPLLSLHRFPKNEGLKKKWLDAIGEENINPRHKEWYLCSLHFEESCFNRTLDVMRLHDNSVPTVFSAPDKKHTKSHVQVHQESSVLCETSNIKKSAVFFTSTVIPPLQSPHLIVETVHKEHPVLVARSSLDWMPSRVNSLYSDVGAWSGKFRPVMDEIESDEALRFYQFLNYLDGSSFGTGPIDEFVDAMGRLANYMKQQNSRETQARGMRELEAINGEKGNSIKTVLEVSTLIMRKKRKFFCTGEVKEPIVNNKIICKDRILLPIAGASCRDAIMYWHPDLTEEHYCVGALEAKSAVHIMDIEGDMFCKGDDYSKREFLLACDFYEDQEAPVADLLQYYPDPDPEITPKLF